MPTDSTPVSVSVSGELSRATPEVQKYRPRACQSCARSKMRCVWPSEPGATPCQRCAKIKTQCTLPEINPRRRRGPSTRVGQLEEKIDGIMSLLNASQQIQQNSPSSSGQTPPSSASATLAGPEQSRSGIQQLLNPVVEPSAAGAGGGGGGGGGTGTGSVRASDVPDVTSTPSSTSNYHANARFIPPSGLLPAAGGPAVGRETGNDGSNIASDRDFVGAAAPAPRPAPPADNVEIIPGFQITFYEADRALNLYRSIYSPYFPFVTVPVMLTAYEFYEKTPFLFRTVVSVAAPQSPGIQADFKVWFREYVAQHVVVNNERRLEILQALLVHIAWGDFHYFIDSQATNLMQLAVSLTIDLGLNRWPLDFGKASFLLVKEASMQAGMKNIWKRKHSLDEMRAALGIFYVVSLCSSLFRRHHPLPYNSYLNHCCETVEQAEEDDSDKFLVALVKIQQLLNRVSEIIPYGDDEAARRVNFTPIHMALTAIRKELDALIRDQPPEVECNALLWTHYHGTICRMYEPAIYVRSTSPSGYDASEATARTAALWQCLTSARDFFSAFMVIPPQNLVCIPFHGVHLAFAVVTASRLMFLGDESSGGQQRDPDWVVSVAREHLNFDAVCARLGDLFDEADRLTTGLGRRGRYLDADRSLMGIFRDKLRWIRNWYLGRTRPETQEAFPGASRHAEGQGRGGGLAGGLMSSKDGGAGAGEVLGSQAAGSHASAASGGVAGGSNIPTQTGQAMDVDYGSASTQSNFPMLGELDETFWQAIFDMNFNGSIDWTEVQG